MRPGHKAHSRVEESLQLARDNNISSCCLIAAQILRHDKVTDKARVSLHAGEIRTIHKRAKQLTPPFITNIRILATRPSYLLFILADFVRSRLHFLQSFYRPCLYEVHAIFRAILYDCTYAGERKSRSTTREIFSITFSNKISHWANVHRFANYYLPRFDKLRRALQNQFDPRYFRQDYSVVKKND